MNNPNLLTRSSYTFFNSLLKIRDIIDLTLSNGFSNAFLVDKNIMYGTMEFYKLCKANDIKPIVGLQIDYNDTKEIIIAKNTAGYKELMKVSSMIQLEADLVIDYTNLHKVTGLITPVLYKEATDIKALKDFNLISGQLEFNEASTHFLSREEFETINGKEMLKQVDDLVEQVDFEIKERVNVLPSYFHEGKKVDSSSFLKKELEVKLKAFLTKNPKLNKEVYFERSKYELDIIAKMGFESYFLIVADIVRWSKDNGIFVGPGRGSAPGSIISYLLDITTIDPVANDLLFERFLNPDRVSMPDIDIDFEDTRRDEVIEYITNRYGRNNVAQIITYQTLRARMSFKDTARIKGLSATETNAITKLILEDSTLEESYAKAKNFRAKIDSSEMLKDIFETAKLLEGLPRQFSTHAAGVVLSDEPIFKSVPVQKGYGSTLQTQYSMDYMEYNGLLKIDVLGLRNLSFIRETLDNIKINTGIEVKLEDIKFDDPKVYKILSSGKTSGVFQLESPGMRSSLKDIKVSVFEDIVATTSLFRPGPMKMIPEFAARKNGQHPVTYLNDDIKKILEPTYGVIVYQEQIMQMVQVFSNFTLSKADILRRAIGKKDTKLLSSLKEEFFSGAKENGFEDIVIQETYDLIYEFSNYGFNRSHAFAYTTISYWLAYLKINFPLEFMNSLLNSVIGNATKTPAYISECEDLGIEVNEPSIFDSISDYQINGKTIYVGLRTIKRIGESIIRNITVLQSNIKKGMDIMDFFIAAEQAGISMGALEILIKANALRDFGYNKETLITTLPRVEEYLKMIRVTKDEVVTYNKTLIPAPVVREVEAINEKEYFTEVMGFGLSDKAAAEEFKTLETELKIKSDDLQDLKQDEKVTFIGEVVSVRALTTKTGKKMAFASLTNGTKKVNVTYWPATYEKFENLLKPTQRAIFYGSVDLKRGETIIINKMEEIK